MDLVTRLIQQHGHDFRAIARLWECGIDDTELCATVDPSVCGI